MRSGAVDEWREVRDDEDRDDEARGDRSDRDRHREEPQPHGVRADHARREAGVLEPPGGQQHEQPQHQHEGQERRRGHLSGQSIARAVDVTRVGGDAT